MLNSSGILIKKSIIQNLNYLDLININIYRYLDIKNKNYNRSDNCLHHLLCYDKHLFIDLLKNICDIEEIFEFFKMNYIIHSFGAVINKPKSHSYTHQWHIDTYEETTENYMLNILIPLTDFTLENGCTKIYPKNSINYTDILINKGDILCFNSSLKHCTGNNLTNKDRNCLTITLVKIYLKPQFNYLTLYSREEIEVMEEYLKKLLNYYGQNIETLTDFYNRKQIFK
jgi:ectoine hydroxylase-related dioxygenase (phytanoyl-CoA dioxygenase family)